ncbi:PREDICTED: uncharacterized protein LOC106337970 [Brassica oleracea var. oleracea]|uniref:uncharacterized protein LOC106337970 n=1 Tax=Brassica oleracea var. oleracea TaxID=109376 RepID=UPI0006A6F156|nr:PREDICTED: uncharacterized protein LOC106337970 [Brassica oleracea var. oleracea]
MAIPELPRGDEQREIVNPHARRGRSVDVSTQGQETWGATKKKKSRRLDSGCINTKSRGPTNLVPRVEDIKALEREIARQRREVEQQTHLQRLGFDMKNLPQDGDAQGGIDHLQRPTYDWDHPCMQDFFWIEDED